MSYVDGAYLRAGELRAHYWRYGFCASDFYVNFETALQDVPGMAIELEPDTYYAVDGFVAYDADATSHVKFSLNGIGGTSAGSWAFRTINDQAGPTTSENMNSTRGDGFRSGTAQFGNGATAGLLACLPRAVAYAGPPGILKVQMAQINSGAYNTTVKRGSWFRVMELPHP